MFYTPYKKQGTSILNSYPVISYALYNFTTDVANAHPGTYIPLPICSSVDFTLVTLSISAYAKNSYVKYRSQNSFAVMISIPSNSCKTRRSLSPLTMYMAFASFAQPRNLSSSGSRLNQQMFAAPQSSKPVPTVSKVAD